MAEKKQEEEPDLTEDPRQQDKADEGNAEVAPAPAPVDGDDGAEPKPDSEQPPGQSPSGGHLDSPPSKATGNPNAAGP